MVEELRTRGMTDIDCHSLLNMIFQGWLVSGQPTKEFMNLMIQAQASKRLVEKEEPKSVIVSRSGESIRSS